MKKESRSLMRRSATVWCVLVVLPMTYLFLISICAAEKSSAAKSGVTSMTKNPLLTESTLPFHIPPFDKIKNEHFKPAYEKGMAEELKEIEAIARNPEPPTFENTIVAMERSGQLLGRVDRIFSNLNACNTNPAMQETDKEMAPKLSAHQDEIHLNGPLFARVGAIYNDRDKLNLDPESKWLVERYYKDFVRAGAKLSDADKARLKKINAELAELQTTFE